MGLAPLPLSKVLDPPLVRVMVVTVMTATMEHILSVLSEVLIMGKTRVRRILYQREKNC